jgi:hypothetical protein
MRGSSVAGALIGVLFLLLLVNTFFPGAPAFPSAEPGLAGVGTALWEGRALEVLLQGFILLAGAAAVLLFLGSRTPREGS